MENMENAARKKVMLSGIQPSGDLTLGSYLGAIKNWAERDEEFDNYYFMADMHSITVRQDPAALRRRTLEQLAQYIACGLNPEQNTLFIQSHVPQHTQLSWVLSCYTMFGVQIRHKIVTVKGFRPFRPIFDGAQVRTEGQITAGLDTGKHDFFFIHVNTTFSLAVGQKPIGRVFYYVRSVYHVYTKIAIKL